ncbi:MAG: cyclic nucleotide-binding domain-containing protein [Acidobacteria bacterium]|nr:cyclic nucleotide-binding domain-containing protein [Acidobacteriota bacterium]NIM61587.1 cyclic nucleotide-binding domain-containing protein [Acidobacteriota bacterium]NIO58151.1 cyclic nucleotide-binding domain-containing protein [Acidobacteriota bacterium]NIQ29167.1 cyclic nucleotide-binding domain-containing protein [Acidobacteriota bacterium]NIQ85079.1 cyclic nucleotide-binding domain-containing protein [Acidobacteriota bacterium]
MRVLLVVGYVGVVVLGFVTDVQPRVFWTMLLPLLPVSIVLMGYGRWRRICPLAFFGEIGRKLNRGAQRRVPRWFERWFFGIAFAALLAMLVFRLVATNGDGRWLGGLLVVLAIAALVTNTIFTGKTWCNFFCPVSFVERLYTEPRSLRRTPNSQCTRCTACKSSCPDIDAENAYWRDLTSSGRRLATFAFPGLVLAFYTYYWLRHGDWEAYFDGRWTRRLVDAELWFGQGFFFWPELPAVVAATLTLTLFSAASLAVFLLVERSMAGVVDEPERRRHLALGLAAFSAFSIFYFFAGAPSLRQVPGGTRVVAFTMPLLATLFLVKRWNRTHEDFIREKGAAKLLKSWPFDEPPPDDPREVYGWVKAGKLAHEQSVAAYASTVREMIADGLVRKGELRLLEGVREQLGISEREHAKVIDRLSAEERDLFEREDGAGIEGRAQLEGYEAALAEALLRRASDAEVDALRLAFGVTPEDHERLLRQLRGGAGALVQRARDRVEHVRVVRRDLETFSAGRVTDGVAFLTFLLLRDQRAAICRVFEVLEAIGPRESVRALRFRLFGGDRESRRRVVEQLAETCSVGVEIVRQLEPWIVDPVPTEPVHDETAWARARERLALSSDRYLRGAIVWVASQSDEPGARRIVGGGLKDADPLVREIAHRILFGKPAPPYVPFNGLADLQKMQYLRGIRLFSGLDPEDLHDLCGFVTEETFRPGETLCSEGDVDNDDFFVVLEGRASVSVTTPDGEREVAVLAEGEVVGEMSMLDGSPRSATARPKAGGIRVLRVSGEKFRRRLLPRARVAAPLLATLAERIRNVSH